MIALNIDVSALSLNAARRVHTAWASDRAPVPSMGADGSRSDMVAKAGLRVRHIICSNLQGCFAHVREMALTVV